MPAPNRLPILEYGHPTLTQKTTPVENIEQHHIDLIKKMKATLLLSGGVGLAANQIGASDSIFLFRVNHFIEVAINPHLQVIDESPWEYMEGCLSVPGFTFPVLRPSRVLLVATNLDGETFTKHAEGLTARIFQHEMDHLNGKLYVDLLSPQAKEKVKLYFKKPDEPAWKKKKKKHTKKRK